MNTKVGIELPTAKIIQFCQRHHIRRLSLFGSVLGENFGPQSDVDFLVEFEPGYIPSLFSITDMEFELTELVGRKADLRTAADLSQYFRQEVLDTAKILYERKRSDPITSHA